MLCPAALKQLLNQANTQGVDSTLLISRDGSVMGHSGNTTDRHAMVTAAVASNVWGSYEKAGRAANLTMSPSKTGTGGNGNEHKEAALHHVIMNCEEGLAGVALVPGTDYIVSIFANDSCQPALLKEKLVALIQYLEEPLSKLAQDSSGSSANNF